VRVIIAGGRDFADYPALCAACDLALSRQPAVEVVSGTAKGADALGERYARERGHGLRQFPADWDTHGKAAGYRRNAEMAAYAEALIAFWDGKSRGTKHMIDLAHRAGLKVKVITY
jgi:hypothetical protein